MTKTTIENHQPLAVCLHASASSKGQWKGLMSMLERQMRCVAPDLVGYGAGDPFSTRKRFHLRQEVHNVLRQVEEQTGKSNGPLHLVGHSYGGATALQIAVMYPERVASVTLYEPAQFLMLFANGLRSTEAREVLAVWKFAKDQIGTTIGRFLAARRFIEYWSGEGAWQHIPLKRRCRFARLMPKVVAEFEAILSAGVSAEVFAGLNVPVRIICGTATRATARKVCRELARSLPNVELVEVEGATHMAPTTEPDTINPLFAEHVLAALHRDLAAAA